MLIFMKNVKKFVMKERPVLAAVHYHAGRAYASNVYSLVWIEDNLRREGAFDAESGAPVELDAKLPTPSFDKVVPKVNEDSAYATVGNAELIQMLSVLKAVDACAPNRKDFEECMRVLHPYGVLIFKWSEDQISTVDVLKLFPVQPLFGNRRGRAIWLAFMKFPSEEGDID